MKNLKNYKILIVFAVFVVIFSSFCLFSSAENYDIAADNFTCGWHFVDKNVTIPNTNISSQGLSIDKIISGTNVSEGSLTLLIYDYMSNTGRIPSSVYGYNVLDWSETSEGSGYYNYGPVYPYTSCVTNVQPLTSSVSAMALSSDKSRFDVKLNYFATDANRVVIKDGLPTLILSFVVYPSLNFDVQGQGGTYYVNWTPVNPETSQIDPVTLKINGQTISSSAMVQTVSQNNASGYTIGRAIKYNVAVTIDQKSSYKIDTVNTFEISLSLYNGGYKFEGSSSQTGLNQNVYPIFRLAMSDIGFRTADMTVAEATSQILASMNGQTDKLLGFFSQADEATTQKIQQAVLQVENTDKTMAESINNFWNMLIVPEEPFNWIPLPFFKRFFDLFFEQAGWGITVVSVLVFLFALRFITSSAGQWFDNLGGLGNKKDKGEK